MHYFYIIFGTHTKCIQFQCTHTQTHIDIQKHTQKKTTEKYAFEDVYRKTLLSCLRLLLLK